MNTVTPLIKPFIADNAGVSPNGTYQISASTVSAGTFPTGVGVVAVSNATNAKILFAGTGADNSTYSVRLYAKVGIEQSSENTDVAYTLALMGTADITLSTLTGPTASTLLAGIRIADTVVWTPADPFSTIALANGADTGTAYSPANNTPAYLILPYLGGAFEVVTDYDMGTATGGITMLQPETV